MASPQPNQEPREAPRANVGNIANVSSSRKLTCSARMTTLDSGANAAVKTWYTENATPMAKITRWARADRAGAKATGSESAGETTWTWKPFLESAAAGG